ncbi:Uncharacterised protein [Enterobacter asburiae]|uniref:Uncharacterized protein n=1 Tax=Enterobacter asburiae TaxID=61645 RepID=A0A376F3R8_ENTAS|nr:Uncharacterised protein [Enterobacter asburiae]
MPVYATPEELNNGFTPAGNVLAAPTGFDVPLPEGTNPEPQQDEPSVWGQHFARITCLAKCSAGQTV